MAPFQDPLDSQMLPTSIQESNFFKLLYIICHHKMSNLSSLASTCRQLTALPSPIRASLPQKTPAGRRRP